MSLSKYSLKNVPAGGVSRYLPGLGLIPIQEAYLTDEIVERFIRAGVSEYFEVTTKVENGKTSKYEKPVEKETSGSGAGSSTASDSSNGAGSSTASDSSNGAGTAAAGSDSSNGAGTAATGSDSSNGAGSAATGSGRSKRATRSTGAGAGK